MPVFVEKGLQFEFDDNAWQARHYDANGGDYRTVLSKIPETKAVDFVGIHQRGGRPVLYLIEATDYSSNLHNLAEVSRDGGLATEFAQKVRDTVAGLTLLARQTASREQWLPFLKHLADPGSEIRFVLWVRNGNGSEQQRQAQNSTILDQVKKRLRIARQKVFVPADLAHVVPDVCVRST